VKKATICQVSKMKNESADTG